MADKRILQERVVKFGISGMDAVYEAQKKIAKNAKDSLKDQKELLKTLSAGTEAYKAQAKNVDKANAYYERQKKLLQDLGKQASTVLDIISNKTVESGKKLETATKSIIKGVKSISLKDLDAAEAEKLRGHIAGLVKEMTGLQAQANAIGQGFQDMTAKLKTNGLAYEELARYVKMYEQNGRALADNTANSNKAFAQMGENATAAKIRMGQLDGTLLSVSKNANAERLQAYIKGWQDIAKYGGASAAQIKQANENIAKAETLMLDMMERRLNRAGTTNFFGIENYTPAQIREAIQYMREYANTSKMTTEEREKMNASIKKGEQYLKQLDQEQQRHAMIMQLGGNGYAKIRTLSDAAISSQKKYWTEMSDSAQRGTTEYNTYLATLKAVTDEEQRRASEKIRTEGQALVTKVNNGQFVGTIKETDEAIKKIQEYKRELRTDDRTGLEATTNALNKLNEALAQTKQDVIDGKQAFNNLHDAAIQGVDDVVKILPSSTKELQAMRTNLEAFKKSLKSAEPEKLKQIETMLTAIDRKTKQVASSEIKWEKYRGSELKKRSLTELKNAYETLKKEIESLSPAQKGYNEKAMQLKAINEQVKRLNSHMAHHVSTLENAFSRLKNYVMIYIGFNALMNKTREIIHNTIELSDQMTNVQKVTQLTTEEIERMTNAIQSIDTRMSNQQLMEMAEQAGKLGIATREGADGLVSFVKEGQKILNTLGDIGGAEAINDLLKVNDVVNKQSEGLEKDLNKIGSAILNVGNNSKATYADVVEFTKRLGATGSVTGLTMQQIFGLGGAFSSLGETMERSSTATQRVVLGIVSHTKDVAQALNIGYDELDQMIQAGKTFEALELVLTELGEQGPAVYDKFFKAIGGRNNVQARNAMALLSQHIGELNYQVALAEEGFAEGTLVTQEFERANNNLAGVMAQVGNEFYEMTTSVEGTNGAMLDIAKGLLSFVKWLREWNILGGVVIATLLVLTKQLIVNAKAWWQDSAAAALNESTYKGFKGTLFGLIQIIYQGIKALALKTAALLGSAAAAEKARQATERFKIAWSSNWLALVLTALGMLIGYLMRTAKATADARKSLGELQNKVEDEIASLNSLYRSLKNVNLAQQDRTNKINAFNRMFGGYLSKLLREEDVAKRLKIAYHEAAAAIREKNAAAMEEKGKQAAEEASGDDQREAIGAMIEALMQGNLGENWAKRKGISSYDRSNIASSIQSVVLQMTEEGVPQSKSEQEKLKKRIQAELGRRLGNDQRLVATTWGTGRDSNTKYETNQLTGQIMMVRGGKRVAAKSQSRTTRLQKAVNDYINAVLEGEMARAPFVEQAKGQEYMAQDEEIRLMTELRKQIVAAQQNTKKTSMDYRELYANITKYRELNEKYEKDPRNKYGAKYSAEFAKAIPQLLEYIKPWGKTSFDLSEQAGADLADVVDFFNDIYKNWRSGQDIQRTSAHKTPAGVTIPSDINFWTKEQIRNWAYTNWQEAKKMQETDNFANPKGDFKDFKDKKKKGQKEKEEFEAAIASLDKYYKDRETLINISLNNEEITESEANRRKESLEAEHLMKRSQLRRDAIGKMDEGEMNAFEAWWDGVEELDKVNFKRLREQSKEWGKAYVQGVALASSKDLSEIEKMLQAHKQKIDKILEEGDSVKKVTDAFKTAMDDLDMIFALREGEASRTAALGNQRANQLMEWSKKAYSMEVSDLKAAMQETGNIYHAWFEALGDDQDGTLQAMLLRLRQYHDDMDEVVRKAAKERKRLFDMVYNNAVGEDGMTNQQRNTAQTDHAQSAISGQQLSQRWGYGGDNLTNNAELNLINLQIEQKLKYIKALKEQLKYETALSKQSEEALERQIVVAQSNPALSGGEYSPEEKAQAEAELADLQNQLAQKRQDTANLELETNVLLAESEKELTELRAEQVDKQIENYQRMFDYLKEIQGEFEGFAESFGEGIFGSKEDRKNAALDLVADVLKTTKNIAQQYLVEIATKKSADQTIVALEQIKNTQLMMMRRQLLADYGAQKIAELSVEAATDSAGVTSAVVAGTSKEVSKRGLAGLATSAAIGIGLSLLLGLALGALNKAKNTTATATGASSGAGKLATGMLTYGKGRYPVYANGAYADDGNGRVQGQLVSVRGNDGQTYAAKYQPNLKTGVVNGPHLGIVGEKGAEVIIDHQTYEGLKRYDPETLRRIYAMKQYGMRSIDFSKTARMGNEVVMNRGGVRAYADGNIGEVISPASMPSADGTMESMRQTLSELSSVLADIKQTGIPAIVDYYGKYGMRATGKKGDRFAQRRGIDL